MKYNSALIRSCLLAASLMAAVTPCALASDIQVTQIKLAHDIDANFAPVEPTESFLPDTAKIYCWFEWTGAEVNEPLTASWRFIEGNIPVLDYNLFIPRKQGAGGVALSMPQGKKFPAGAYEVTLKSGSKALKSAQFSVREK